MNRSLLLIVLCLAGCGDKAPERVPVSGQVLIDGKPLTQGFVRILPDGARPSLGKLDANGRFTLEAKQDVPGVPLGEHPVEIHAIEVLNAGSQRRHVPALYENHELSKLRVKIDGATEALVINLTWEGSGKKGPYVESFGKE
jgi:hypothetical protein